MTRLHYWLHAQTQYSIHSPFLFDMYREVLFARLTPEERRRHGIPRHDRYQELIYKCCNHYHLHPTANSPQATFLQPAWLHKVADLRFAPLPLKQGGVPLHSQLSPFAKGRGVPVALRARLCVKGRGFNSPSTLLTPAANIQHPTSNSQQPTANSQQPTANSQLSILLLSRPHATPAAEQQWEKLKADPDYQVSIDLYDVALLIRNPHLHRQHFLLR